MIDHVLRTSRLGKRYRGRWALQELDLELPRGKIAALVGPNGAGKTTLLMLATGLLAPTAGSIEVLGTDPTRAGMPAGLSFLAQGKPLYPRFTVAEMLRAAATLNAGTWDAGYAAKLVAAAELTPEQRIGDLSAGARILYYTDVYATGRQIGYAELERACPGERTRPACAVQEWWRNGSSTSPRPATGRSS
jgi:ABC-2 type transport system ATP-binding protein